MKRLIYTSLKLAIGTIVAIFIAEILGFQYATTAGIIALLSILDTRKQTYIVGVKRVASAILAIGLVMLLFALFGHSLLIFALFMMVYIPLITGMKLTEGLSISAVLATHIYTLESLTIMVAFNELGLLIIGILVAWVLNLHVINIESEIKKHQVEAEETIISILHKMKLQLLNQCSIEEQELNLSHLDEAISEGARKAYEYEQNHVLKDDSYYIEYFKMRRQQYELLKYMENHFRHMFVSVDEAKLLSDFTEKIAESLDECNDGMALLSDLNDLKTHYRSSQLPISRDEFENRATLFQYLNDLEYFIKLKAAFMVQYGAIHYCE